MKYIQQGVLESKEERQKFRHAPRFAPAGQSTQMIVGATSESDKDILYLSSALYGRPTMKRVYYSGYVSVNTYDTRLPALNNRLWYVRTVFIRRTGCYVSISLKWMKS